MKMTEDESYIIQLLFHFQTGIQYNLHGIYQIEGALEAGKKIPLVDIGAGVYPTTLFFNHSCAPNTLRINQGSRHTPLHLGFLVKKQSELYFSPL